MILGGRSGPVCPTTDWRHEPLRACRPRVACLKEKGHRPASYRRHGASVRARVKRVASRNDRDASSNWILDCMTVSRAGAARTGAQLVVWVGTIVALAQVFVILSFAVGWFLISPSLTDAQVANGEDGFQLSHVTGWAQDSSAYALLVILIGVLVGTFWLLRTTLHPWVFWVACAALALVIPAQQTVLGPVFN